MPGFDRTGPSGQGPRTGRGLGPCGGGQAFGRGRGAGRGMGFGRGYGFRQPTTEDTQAYIEDLEAELKAAKQSLKDSK